MPEHLRRCPAQHLVRPAQRQIQEGPVAAEKDALFVTHGQRQRDRVDQRLLKRNLLRQRPFALEHAGDGFVLLADSHSRIRTAPAIPATRMAASAAPAATWCRQSSSSPSTGIVTVTPSGRLEIRRVESRWPLSGTGPVTHCLPERDRGASVSDASVFPTFPEAPAPFCRGRGSVRSCRRRPVPGVARVGRVEAAGDQNPVSRRGAGQDVHQQTRYPPVGDPLAGRTGDSRRTACSRRHGAGPRIRPSTRAGSKDWRCLTGRRIGRHGGPGRPAPSAAHRIHSVPVRHNCDAPGPATVTSFFRSSSSDTRSSVRLKAIRPTTTIAKATPRATIWRAVPGCSGCGNNRIWTRFDLTITSRLRLTLDIGPFVCSWRHCPGQ